MWRKGKPTKNKEKTMTETLALILQILLIAAPICIWIRLASVHNEIKRQHADEKERMDKVIEYLDYIAETLSPDDAK